MAHGRRACGRGCSRRVSTPKAVDLKRDWNLLPVGTGGGSWGGLWKHFSFMETSQQRFDDPIYVRWQLNSGLTVIPFIEEVICMTVDNRNWQWALAFLGLSFLLAFWHLLQMHVGTLKQFAGRYHKQIGPLCNLRYYFANPISQGFISPYWKPNQPVL